MSRISSLCKEGVGRGTAGSAATCAFVPSSQTCTQINRLCHIGHTMDDIQIFITIVSSYGTYLEMHLY